MERPYTVSLDLYRGAAYTPYARTKYRVLAESELDACSLAERNLNTQLDDIEYAAATDAHPIWKPDPAVSAVEVASAA